MESNTVADAEFLRILEKYGTPPDTPITRGKLKNMEYLSDGTYDYEGEIQNGVPHGKGEMVHKCADGNVIHYKGNFYGKYLPELHGYGERWDEKDCYEYKGMYRNGYEHGFGITITHDGQKTMGFKKKFARHGKVVKWYKNGKVQMFNYIDDER